MAEMLVLLTEAWTRWPTIEGGLRMTVHAEGAKRAAVEVERRLPWFFGKTSRVLSRHETRQFEYRFAVSKHRSWSLALTATPYSQQEHLTYEFDGQKTWRRVGEHRKAVQVSSNQAPLIDMLDPSWILAGRTLTVLMAELSGGRQAYRIVAETRYPAVRLVQYFVTSVEALVDSETGILLSYQDRVDNEVVRSVEMFDFQGEPV